MSCSAALAIERSLQMVLTNITGSIVVVLHIVDCALTTVVVYTIFISQTHKHEYKAFLTETTVTTVAFDASSLQYATPALPSA
jgi:hypothetical protein